MNILNSYNHNYSHYHSVLYSDSTNMSGNFLLLDRDGVLIEDVHHIVDPCKVTLRKNSAELIKSAIEYGYNVAILTNQSFLARRLSSFQSYLDVTERMFDLLTHQCLPHLVLASFWHSDFSTPSPLSNWRKPDVGMFNFLTMHHRLDPRNSLMIGDKLTDLLPAAESNINHLVHIHSPAHSDELNKVEEWAVRFDQQVNYLSDLPPSIFSLLA